MNDHVERFVKITGSDHSINNLPHTLCDILDPDIVIFGYVVAEPEDLWFIAMGAEKPS
jgi:hypothetical protein